MPVPVVRNYTSTQINYFLAGLPAPSAILLAAGITDGEIFDYYSYSFYSPNIGFVGSIYMNSTNTAITGATFRRKLQTGLDTINSFKENYNDINSGDNIESITTHSF